MRAHRILRQMAGLTETLYQKMIKRRQRDFDRRVRVLSEEALLLDMISRRQDGAEGTAPMPFRTLKSDIEKMAKGEL